MGLAFGSGARDWGLLRASRRLTELAQIHLTGEVEQPGGESLRAGLCEQGPFLLGYGDGRTDHGGGDLAGQVVLRDGLVDRLGRMGGAQCHHDHGIEVKFGISWVYLPLAELLYESGPAYAEGRNFGPNDEDAKPVGWIVVRMANFWGSEARWEIDPGEHPHEANWLKLDRSNARSGLGWHPALNLDDALALVVAWSRARSRGINIRELTLAQISDYQRLTPS